MVNAALERGAEIVSIDHIEQREWNVVGKISEEDYSVGDKDINVALAKFLQKVLRKE